MPKGKALVFMRANPFIRAAIGSWGVLAEEGGDKKSKGHVPNLQEQFLRSSQHPPYLSTRHIVGAQQMSAKQTQLERQVPHTGAELYRPWCLAPSALCGH